MQRRFKTEISDRLTNTKQKLSFECLRPNAFNPTVSFRVKLKNRQNSISSKRSKYSLERKQIKQDDPIFPNNLRDSILGILQLIQNGHYLTKVPGITLRDKKKRLKKYSSITNTINKIERNKKDKKLSQFAIKVVQNFEFNDQIYKNKLGYEGSQGKLKEYIQISQQLSASIHNFQEFQQNLQNLNTIAEKTRNFMFRSLTTFYSGLLCFEFSNLTLSIFYFDRTLRNYLYLQQPLCELQRQIQLRTYQQICRIFLKKNVLQSAKQFAYKLLRKAWYYNSKQFQSISYDILGLVQSACQNIELSEYFHNKMSMGQLENSVIKRISNSQIQKSSKEPLQLTYSEQIEKFIKNDLRFNQILKKNYQNEARLAKISQQIQLISNQRNSQDYSRRKQRIEFPRFIESPNKKVYLTHKSHFRYPENNRAFIRGVTKTIKTQQFYIISSKTQKKIKNDIQQFKNITDQIDHYYSKFKE